MVVDKKPKAPKLLRSGRWTKEEEAYANVRQSNVPFFLVTTRGLIKRAVVRNAATNRRVQPWTVADERFFSPIFVAV
jgi:hypothetical protein